jgi:hypothetical protein
VKINRDITIKIIKNKNISIYMLAEFFSEKYKEEVVKKQNIKS